MFFSLEVFSLGRMEVAKLKLSFFNSPQVEKKEANRVSVLGVVPTYVVSTYASKLSAGTDKSKTCSRPCSRNISADLFCAAPLSSRCETMGFWLGSLSSRTGMRKSAV